MDDVDGKLFIKRKISRRGFPKIEDAGVAGLAPTGMAGCGGEPAQRGQ
ncbi:hypothetical protein BH18ACT10_BH18ACT10_18820 [soil metagenome]